MHLLGLTKPMINRIYLKKWQLKKVHETDVDMIMIILHKEKKAKQVKKENSETELTGNPRGLSVTPSINIRTNPFIKFQMPLKY